MTENQWQEYNSQGFTFLGKVLTEEELAILRQRIDEIMLGSAPLNYDRMLMQLDQPDTGKLGPQTNGHKVQPYVTAKYKGWNLTHTFWPI